MQATGQWREAGGSWSGSRSGSKDCAPGRQGEFAVCDGALSARIAGGGGGREVDTRREGKDGL